ncbi:MAG: Oxygen sensor histidine kinase NreB [Bacteroidota bacterium]|jgi:signal transduction histidine kinase
MQLGTEEIKIAQTVIAVALAFLSIALVMILFFYFSRKKIVQKEIEKRELEVNYQKELLHSVLYTQEAERKRIAQDLHDDISSKLNVVSLHTHLLATPDLTESERIDIMHNISELTGKALENSRRIAHDLLPPVFERFGLHAGIEELVLEFNKGKTIQVEYSNSVKFDAANSDQQLHIFRILQELLNNSLRHGKATQATISMQQNGVYTQLNYSDNGVGFDKQDVAKLRGLGLKNIESRVGILNGTYQLESQPNQGVQYQFQFLNL